MKTGCLVCGNPWKGPTRFCNVCGAPREEVLPETIEGIKAFELGEYRESLRWFEKALKKRPGKALAQRDVGHASFHLQDLHQAQEHYQEALKIQPSLLDAHYNLGLIHMGRGHVNDALTEFDKALDHLHPIVSGRYYLGLFHDTDTLTLQCRVNLGMLLRQRGELEKAVAQYRLVLRDFPKNVLALGNMGDCYLALERYNEAIRLYRLVLKLVPEGADRLNVYNDLGVTYYKKGDMEKAVQQFKIVLKEDPNHVNAIYNLGQIYYNEGLTGRMQKDYAEFVKSSKDPASLLFALSKSMLSVAASQRTIPSTEETLLIGDSDPMQEVKELIKRAAASDATVIILGENGTGKELVARSIHQMSPRYDKPFVPIACSALSESLLESELFGHEKGSFTGAVGQKLGKFEVANQGTVFLDEIGEMSLSTQVKLLRFLQEREFERVGGTDTVQVNIRVIAATNRDLKRAVQDGRFREDLYYRLNVITVVMPPLRERGGDLEALIAHFLRSMRQKRPTRFEGVSPETLAFLKRYRWPGNVRELENLVERVVTLYDDAKIRPEHLPTEIAETRGMASGPGSAVLTAGGYALESAEREVILKVFRESKYNKKQTALKLGISRPTLYMKIRKYGLKAESA